MADVGVFIAWCEANGYREGLEIDRIDNNSGYRPDNCRFVTRKQNMWNIRKNFLLDFSGERKPLAQWCNELGLNYSRTYQRLHKLNMPVEKAFLQTALRNTHV